MCVSLRTCHCTVAQDPWCIKACYYIFLTGLNFFLKSALSVFVFVQMAGRFLCHSEECGLCQLLGKARRTTGRSSSNVVKEGWRRKKSGWEFYSHPFLHLCPCVWLLSCGLYVCVWGGGDAERVRKQGKCSEPAGVPPPARHPSALQPMAQRGERQRLKKAGKTQRNSDMPLSQPESNALAIFPWLMTSSKGELLCTTSWSIYVAHPSSI